LDGTLSLLIVARVVDHDDTIVGGGGAVASCGVGMNAFVDDLPVMSAHGYRLASIGCSID